MSVKSVSVFTGSKHGKDPLISAHVIQLGELLGQQAELVRYGGGQYGYLKDLMNGVSNTDAKMEAIISSAYYKEDEQYPEFVSVIKTVTDIERNKQFSLSDAFIVTAGGDGTIAEATHMQYQNVSATYSYTPQKPIIFVNTNDYFNGLRTQYSKAIEDGYSDKERQANLHFVNSPTDAVKLLYPKSF